MVTLLSQDELPDQERSRVSLRLVSGETIEASICTGQRCPIVQPQEEDNTLVISIVVSVLITISVLLLVLLATFLVRRIHFWYVLLTQWRDGYNKIPLGHSIATL